MSPSAWFYGSTMRCAATILFVGFLLLISPAVGADSGPMPSLPIYDHSFDDVDPAVMQAEVTQQISTFLRNLDQQWETSQDQHRPSATEGPERDEQDQFVFARKMADHQVLEGYEFHEGSLVRGEYICLQRPVNGINEFIDFYDAVKQLVTATYGAPVVDRTIWENELYKPLPDYWGVAVQIGHLRYAAVWETANGTITLVLTGHHHSRLMIEYRRRTLVDDSQTA